MSQRVEDIKKTLTDISSGNGMMEMLMEFERTLDSTDIFAYKNWLDGELVHGPKVGRYWFTTVWMYPEMRMPDPDGALRLEKLGCKVSFTKDVFEKPTKVLEPGDWDNPKTKQAKMEYHTVWLVRIELPKKYVTEMLDSFLNDIDDEVEEHTEELAQEFESPEEDMGLDDELGGAETGEDELGDLEL